MAGHDKKRRLPPEPRRKPLSSKKTLSRQERRRGVLRLLLLLALIALTAFLYYFTNSLYPYAFLFFYGAAFALGISYILANRCFSRSCATMQSLPPTMSDEEKRRYLTERDERKTATSWMLYGLISLMLVIGFDLVYLLQGENIMNFFRKLK